MIVLTIELFRTFLGRHCSEFVLSASGWKLLDSSPVWRRMNTFCDFNWSGFTTNCSRGQPRGRRRYVTRARTIERRSRVTWHSSPDFPIGSSVRRDPDCSGQNCVFKQFGWIFKNRSFKIILGYTSKYSMRLRLKTIFWLMAYSFTI
jgi:hypothetical protein